MTYQLTLNDKQARTLAYILDFYTRLTLGQFPAVGDEIARLFDGKIMEAYREIRDRSTQHLMAIQQLTTGIRWHGSYGVGHERQHEDGKIAWDIAAVMRQQIARHEGHEPHSVWHNDPMHYSQQPLPECKVVEP